MDKKVFWRLFDQCGFLLGTISPYGSWLASASLSPEEHVDRKFMVIWVYIFHSRPLFLVVKQVTSGHGSFSATRYLQLRLCFFLLQLVGQKEAVVLARSRLFPGDQVEVRIKPWGVSKPVCLGDLGVTLCSHSLKPLASVHLTSLLFLLISSLFSFRHHCSLCCGFCRFPTISVQIVSVFVFFSFFFLQCVRKVWSSTKAAIRSFRMFFNSSSSSIHFAYICNQDLGAGTYPISHLVRTHPGRFAVPRHTLSLIHSHPAAPAECPENIIYMNLRLTMRINAWRAIL